jgi:uncharacterized protein (TIGR03118 family)
MTTHNYGRASRQGVVIMKPAAMRARAMILIASMAAVAALSGLASCGGSDNGPTATRFKSTMLVSDGAVAAAHTDPNLKNAWGVAFNPKGFVWVANNGTQTATLYDGNGVVQSLVVAIPATASGPASPTGIVFNGSTTDFMVSQAGKTGAAAFIFVGEGGSVTAWSPAVDLTHAITVSDSSAAGAVYKGLAIATASTGQRLYATDFHNNRIDVFDNAFQKVTLAGAFQDSQIPGNFAPFGIQAIAQKLYVTYAQQDADAHDDVAGAGLGFVDVFDTDGHLLQRLDHVSQLNAPWGVTQAPGNFGTLSNDILIGNFGDGTIQAFDPTSGKLVGTVTNPDGSTFAQSGLWGLAFGNGLNAQPTNTLFFAAGPNDEADGVYGRLDMQ